MTSTVQGVETNGSGPSGHPDRREMRLELLKETVEMGVLSLEFHDPRRRQMLSEQIDHPFLPLNRHAPLGGSTGQESAVRPRRSFSPRTTWWQLCSRVVPIGTRDLDSGSRLMREEAAEGRLEEQAAECVIRAAGGESSPRVNPDGLTDRAMEVLRVISGGLTNCQVAEELYISPKTVGRRVENIYTKIGVSTRAGAAVYAMNQRLLG